MIVRFVGLQNTVQTFEKERPESVQGSKVFDAASSVYTPVMVGLDGGWSIQLHICE